MAGFADGVQSALAIPLVYDATVYGVVGVYASGTDAFSERERTSFEALGEMAGFAVTAARNRALLLSDAVTEVTFDVGADSALAGLGRALDARITLDGLVPQEEAMLCFVAVESEGSTAVQEAVAETDGVRSARLVDDAESGATVEVEVHGSTPLLAVSSLGGTVREAAFDGGSGRLVAEFPRESDLRRVVEAVGEDHDAAVVAKRERERSVTSARDLRDDLAERLTERQETALRTAYLADYFESPRGSTAEEVAASLDITGSTLLHHLRAGQRKLLDALFDDGAAPLEEP
jgi:predicted DNA binding protein